ncbi:hypothetical protein [Lishizhenia tianjinensis]|nr:hypothetical protein [Lishizhenia tianjinensis]
MINISVDSKDPNAFRVHEDTSINDQESLLEIFVEKILGFENAFAEYDDQDGENQQPSLEKSTKLDFYPSSFTSFHAHVDDEEKQNVFALYLLKTKDGHPQKFTPPPQVI